MERVRTALAVSGMLFGVLVLYAIVAACLYLQGVGILPEATRP
jgi:hypothetical protein